MELNSLLNTSCVVGLSYFNPAGELLKQSQLCGEVTAVDAEEGIAITLLPVTDENTTQQKPPAVFHLPPTLTAWFSAPAGRFSDSETGRVVENPAYLVTWDVYQTKGDAADGEHIWWEWIPRTEAPQVSS